MRLEHLQDEELLLLAEEDKKAFRVIYDRYWSKLYRYAFNVLKDEAACEDIIQEVFTDLWQKIDLGKIQQLSAYLFQAVKFQVFKQLRNGKTTQRHLDRIRQLQQNTTTEERMEAFETEAQIKRLVAGLPERCRHIFVLSRFEHMSNQEIADLLGISIQTVKNQISKALSHLREHLDLAKMSMSILWALAICGA